MRLPVGLLLSVALLVALAVVPPHVQIGAGVILAGLFWWVVLTTHPRRKRWTDRPH